MSLKSRLALLERKLADPDAPRKLSVVIDDEEGRWWDGETEINPTGVDPRTLVIIIGERPDGPQ